MPGHSVPMAALGGFILLFGFLAFNGGSQVNFFKSLPIEQSSFINLLFDLLVWRNVFTLSLINLNEDMPTW